MWIKSCTVNIKGVNESGITVRRLGQLGRGPKARGGIHPVERGESGS